MTVRKSPKLPVLVRIETLRPTGALLETEDHVFTNAAAIAARCGELRAKVRDTRGWTPTFRILVVERAFDPWLITDVTANYKVN
jgi:hypothetical protein